MKAIWALRDDVIVSIRREGKKSHHVSSNVEIYIQIVISIS